VSERQPDWLDDWAGDDAPPPEPADDTPVAVLRHIAAHGNNDSARVAAARALMDKGIGLEDEVDGRAVFDLSHLSGEQLEKALAGFFEPGSPAPPDDGAPLPHPWERRVQRRVRREVKRMAAYLDERVEAAARRLVASQSHATVRTTAEEGGEVVPLRDPAPSQAEQGRRARTEARRSALPPGQRQHVPLGIDPEALARAWPSGRP
jgi:hypothetical protein